MLFLLVLYALLLGIWDELFSYLLIERVSYNFAFDEANFVTDIKLNFSNAHHWRFYPMWGTGALLLYNTV